MLQLRGKETIILWDIKKSKTREIKKRYFGKEIKLLLFEILNTVNTKVSVQ